MDAAALLVFSPACLVRFEGGRTVIAGPGERPPLVTDQPGLAAWLLRFAQPRTAGEALAQLPEGPPRDTAARALGFLLEGGALVAVDTAPTHDAATAHATSRELLAGLAQSVYALGCDVAGFGPYADAALAASGATLDARLRTARDALAGVRAELARHRRGYVDGQLQALGVGPADAVDLHIGCGPYHLTGWINLDIHPAPLAINVLWGLPFAEGQVRRVFLSHLLEHLFYPNDVMPFLREILRVLAPGARVRIVVPDIAACIDAYHARNAAFFAAREQHWGAGDGQATALESFLAYAGAGPDPAWLFQAHKFGYDFETLARALERAGFVDIERSAFMASVDPALRVDANSQVASARHGERFYSLFVEAVKPVGARA